MAPLEPWEKVLVDPEKFLATEHGKIACTACHHGSDSPDKESAHTNLVINPSADPGTYCAGCHENISAEFPKSLHATQAGYWTVIDTRSTPENHPALQGMFDNHCSSCHTTCGDCHVSQPNPVGGGFIQGHVFKKTPSLSRNCTACHGSRVGSEYMGKHEGLKADIHFRKARMKCTDCHDAREMHGNYTAMGMESPPNHRYAGGQIPACENCHKLSDMEAENRSTHVTHYNKLSCNVCHSLEYTSCDGCHVQVSEKTGNPYFSTENTGLGFLIGLNPRKSESRPYDYVPLRHIPIAKDSYQYYGANLLPNFNALPTWAYATPHNIQRKTPQNQRCENCHGNADIFLTANKVQWKELTANRNVIVNNPVPSVDVLLSRMPVLSVRHRTLYGEACLVCHGKNARNPVSDTHLLYSDKECTTCHRMPGQ